MTSRRVELGWRVRKKFAEEIGISDRILGDLENGVRELGVGSNAVLEQALKWRPGSIKATLTGGDPTPVLDVVVEVAAEDAFLERLQKLSDDDLLAELCRRLKQRHQPQHPVPLSITRSPYAPPEDPGVGGDEDPDQRRQFGST